MKHEYRNVCDVIVKNDLCIGCGLCTAICPPKVLRMEFNDLGEYQAIEYKEGCLPNCNLCLEVCPFWDRNENEDGLGNSLFGHEPKMLHQPETGYYLQGFAGYVQVEPYREIGASGGVATWLLENLLTRGMVDYVVCVGSQSNPNQMFKFVVCHTPEEVRAASRSCYYPVELSEVIQYILNNDGRYAVTGLPCFVKGMRLAMRRIPKLRRRIVVICGLVCSQTQSKHYTEYLCKIKGGDPTSLEEVTFRIKDPARPANDYGFRFRSKAGRVKEGSIFFKEGMGELWLNGYFTPTACLFCDDVFAETADITFMDAWLPQYQQDPKGHNLVLVRSKSMLDVLQIGIAAEDLNLKPIGVHEIIKSQQGGLKRKRIILPLRIASKRKENPPYLPRKRVFSTASLEIEERLLYLLRDRVRSIYRNHRAQHRPIAPDAWQLLIYRLLILGISRFSFVFRLFRKITHPSFQAKAGHR